MSTVNGYSCANCSEELLAKRGVDPRQGALKTQLTERAERLDSARASGDSSALRSSTPAAHLAAPVPLGVNAPTPNQALGTRLNLRA